MAAAEWNMDINMTDELEALLLEHGAFVRQANGWPTYDKKTSMFRNDNDVDVYFGHRKIHFYTSKPLARIFFNEQTRGTALIIMIKFPELVVKHTFPKEIA
jgi:hypothetical protein